MAYKQNNNPFVKSSPNKFLGKLLGGIGSKMAGKKGNFIKKALFGGIGSLFGGKGRRGEGQAAKFDPITGTMSDPNAIGTMGNAPNTMASTTPPPTEVGLSALGGSTFTKKKSKKYKK